MNYFLKKKKWLAWVIMLTFLFTSILPSNIMAGNSVAEAAEADYTIAKGKSVEIDASKEFPNKKYFQSQGKNKEFEYSKCTWKSSNSRIATVDSFGKVATVKGVSKGGPVTITATATYERDDHSDKYITKTWDVLVTDNGSELTPQNVYVYVQVAGNTEGLTLNAQSYYTIGVIEVNLPNAESIFNKDLNDFGNREYGAPYLDDITKQAILEKIDRYTVNGDVANKSITTEMLYDGTVKWNTTINWDEKWDKPLGVKNYGLNISRGATDYAEAGTYEWHLDGYLEID